MSLPSERTRRTSPPTGLGAPLPWLALLLVVLLAGACEDGGDPRVTTPTSTTAAARGTSTTFGAADPAEAEIIERYKQFWEARFQANQAPPNPDFPALRDLATGQQLDRVVAETRERATAGLAIRRPEPSVSARRVKLVKLDGEVATLQDCATNDGIVYRVSSGEVVDDSVVTRNLIVTMRLTGGVWRLADTKVVQEWKGVAGCARSDDFSS